MGHVDHGKSSILDRIRGSSVVKGEAGGITQAIGASIIPLDTIKNQCKNCITDSTTFSIPGLLFVDTPGHEAFTNLRKRGGNLADIAILVVDVNEGFKPQTIEAIEILKTYKTPFIIAANKIDLLPNWQSNPDKVLMKSIQDQSQDGTTAIETKIYELVGKLGEMAIQSDRFDRIQDFTKQISIVPVSAETGEGIPELLMLLAGLAQKFLEDCLECDIESEGKGTILEVKEEKGLGTTIDVILYNGKLKKNDTIVIGGLHEPIVTKIRALLEPKELCEMMDKKAKYCNVAEVFSATGVKISAPGMEAAIAGMPIRSCSPDKIDETIEDIQSEIEEVMIQTDETGIIIKADTLGSIEALIKIFKDKGVNIRKATVGNISKRDIAEAKSNLDKDPLTCVVLGFNVDVDPDLNQEGVKVFNSKIIYTLIEEFEKWQEETKKDLEGNKLNFLVRPCKIELLKGYVFRQSNPAVCGVEILGGELKTGMPLMKDTRQITSAKSIQDKQEKLPKAKKGQQVAVSMDHVTFGRQIEEGDILYSAIPEEDFKKLKELKDHLTPDEVEIIKHIAKVMREDNPVWGI